MHGTRIMKTATIAQPASFRFKRQSAAHLRARPPRASRALFVCASHGASSSQSDFDTAEAKDSWAELGISPGASQEAIAQAFRATILRCHPDLHGNAPWAIAKTQRVLRAAEELRAERGGAATGWARAGGRVGDTNGPFLRRGPNVSFYPNSAFDYWSAYGERAPTPEEAARFAQDWEAAKEVAQERLRRQQAQRNGQLIADEAGMKAMPFAAAAAAVLLLFGQVLFVGVSDANMGQPKGAAASGDCYARGGGLCRFL